MKVGLCQHTAKPNSYLKVQNVRYYQYKALG